MGGAPGRDGAGRAAAPRRLRRLELVATGAAAGGHLARHAGRVPGRGRRHLDAVARQSRLRHELPRVDARPRTGKNMGFTDWLFGSATGTSERAGLYGAAGGERARSELRRHADVRYLPALRRVRRPVDQLADRMDVELRRRHHLDAAEPGSRLLEGRGVLGHADRPQLGRLDHEDSAPALSVSPRRPPDDDKRATPGRPDEHTAAGLHLCGDPDVRADGRREGQLAEPGQELRQGRLPSRPAGSDQTYRSYLRFDVTGVSRPIVRAKLRMLVIDDSPIGGEIRPTAAAWSETGSPGRMRRTPGRPSQASPVWPSDNRSSSTSRPSSHTPAATTSCSRARARTASSTRAGKCLSAPVGAHAGLARRSAGGSSTAR